MTDTIFKTCPCCGHLWGEREAFLSDPSLLLNGYQADLMDLEEGLLFFTHEQPDCHSTLAVEVRDLVDLYRGPRYQQRLTDSDQCPRYCRQKDNLLRCDAFCECAFVRELLQLFPHQAQPA